MTYRVLVTDEIDPEGVALLAAESALRVDESPTLPPSELLKRIGDYDAIVGRSATRISPELLRAAKKLKVVGRAGVGVDNVAMDVATELGVAVINAPAGNTVAVAELFFGVVLGILRRLDRAGESMREGRWDRSGLLGGELKGRSLGIVGLGRIGGEVATRAHAFGMAVRAYDPYIPRTRFETLRVEQIGSLDSLIEQSDILTVHTPLTEETRRLIGRREISLLGPQSILVNMARGGIVDEEALADALQNGQLMAGAVDAFTKEPLPADHPLRKTPNLFLTPHIGASTAEAQRNVAVDTCAAVRDALIKGELARSLNIAEIESGRWKEIQPALLLTRRAASVARGILASQGARAVSRVDVRCGSQFAGVREALLAAAAVGVLEGVMENERLNLINARTAAEARGIELSFTDAATASDPGMIEVRLGGGMQELAVAGVGSRITRIGAFHVDVQPRDTLLILANNDVPGVIGHVGTLLGESGVNIAEYHQARLARGGQALAAVSVDGEVSESVRAALLDLPDVLSATVVRFRVE
jgi:D-3-phosphoglycerate dehydrogenase